MINTKSNLLVLYNNTSKHLAVLISNKIINVRK